MNSENTTKVNDLPLGPGVRLITSNMHGLVALDKPAGVMSHPNSGADCKRSLLTANYDYEGEYFMWQEGEVERRAWLVNRLDSPTSGVILVALNEPFSIIMKQMFSTHKVNKVYYALVKRAPPGLAGTWADVLTKDIYCRNKLIKGARRIPAKTRYQVIKKPTGGFPIALMKLMPITGRTHQLRLQCQKHKHPIVGDQTYGSFSFNREVIQETGKSRMMLHSAETSVRYAYNGKMYDFCARSELPESFNVVMRFRPGLQVGKAVPVSTEPQSSSALEGRRFKR